MLLSCASRRQLSTWIAALLIGAALQRAHVLALPPADGTTALPEHGVTSSSVPPAGEPIAESFTRATAIAWALQNNPDLAALRQQHGMAAAAVVIAKTYPFNPVWTNKPFAVGGPESAGVTNRLAMEQRVAIDLEVRGQGRYRLQAACAALSRTDWEIANQETLLAVRVLRAFDNVVYQQARLRLAEEGLQLQEATAEQVRKLFDAGKLHSPDVMLARTEADSYRVALGTARAAQAKAENDLRVLLGMTGEGVKLEGMLTPTPVPDDPQPLLAAALEQRPDLRARQAAVREAEGRRRLAVADRYGNTNFGPDFEYNETRAYFLGAQLTVPLPVLNTHRGEILLREAELNRASLDVRAVEVAVQQQVYAALSRLGTARAMVETYQTRVLPNLETSLKDMDTLFNQSAVDLLKVIDVHRKLLTARSGYLDALYELRQARDDLAAAVADVGLAIDPGSTVPVP